MLKIEIQTECVTYDSDTEIPGISGYGDTIHVEIQGEENCTITIGGYTFMPHQIKWFMDEIEAYKKATAIYHASAK